MQPVEARLSLKPSYSCWDCYLMPQCLSTAMAAKVGDMIPVATGSCCVKKARSDTSWHMRIRPLFGVIRYCRFGYVLPHPQATPIFYIAAVEKNWEKAWDHYYVTGQK